MTTSHFSLKHIGFFSLALLFGQASLFSCEGDLDRAVGLRLRLTEQEKAQAEAEKNKNLGETPEKPKEEPKKELSSSQDLVSPKTELPEQEEEFKRYVADLAVEFEIDENNKEVQEKFSEWLDTPANTVILLGMLRESVDTALPLIAAATVQMLKVTSTPFVPRASGIMVKQPKPHTLRAEIHSESMVPRGKDEYCMAARRLAKIAEENSEALRQCVREEFSNDKGLSKYRSRTCSELLEKVISKDAVKQSERLGAGLDLPGQLTVDLNIQIYPATK